MQTSSSMIAFGRDLKIRRDATEFKIHMPQVKLNKGEYRDIAFARNYETRKMIENALIAEYEKVTRKPKAQDGENLVNRSVG